MGFGLLLGSDTRISDQRRIVFNAFLTSYMLTKLSEMIKRTSMATSDEHGHVTLSLAWLRTVQSNKNLKT